MTGGLLSRKILKRVHHEAHEPTSAVRKCACLNTPKCERAYFGEQACTSSQYATTRNLRPLKTETSERYNALKFTHILTFLLSVHHRAS